ncbi:S8 family serine peptidase [uncultured Kocuria sp.]|uniref:S8 family peptidase n=1 Tax=uncultured Kocuria sp. TaxID=259305 RepID=UPI0025936C83|nr:S8 family serine peptidase [uncultured Kocuria sp.]MCT1366469.1 S8 family serine peptidase [Rothia sp. p3-SID1597]
MTMKRTIRATGALIVSGILAVGLVPVATAEPSPAPSATAGPSHGDDVRNHEYWLDELGIRDAWKKSTGKGVKVAVIDTGVDAHHPDLQGSVEKGHDVSGGGSADGWKPIGAEPEHGTLVASMIAGHGHAGRDADQAPKGEPGQGAGVIGVAPEASIIPISTWLGTENPGGVSVDDQIPRAVKQAVDSGAQVINLSIGSSKTTWPESWDSAFQYAQDHDVVVVASAGNRGSGVTQVGAPSTIPGVVSVGGIDRSGRASWDSSSQGISIAVAAPSEDLIGAMPNNQYGLWSGTSGSAPMVSGVVALMRQKFPDESASQIIQRLISTAKDQGAPGRDPEYGFGVVDPAAALTREEDVGGVHENPLGSVEAWAKIHRRAVPTDEPSQPPEAEHAVGEKIDPVAAPQPQPTSQVKLLLPVVLLVAVAAWMWLIAAGTVARLRRILGSPPHPPHRAIVEYWGWGRRRRNSDGESQRRSTDFWGPRA